MGDSIDFQLDDIVRVRLHRASARDEAAVGRQLGRLRVPVGGEADIHIRFGEQLPSRSTLRYLGDGEFAYDESAFYVLRGKQKSRVLVRIPMEAVGEPLEIVCGSAVPAVPYLLDLINLRALAKGYLPLHASAVRARGRDLLITGWAKGGKTESLLGYAEQGALYIGDEWIYLTADGSEMVGIPEPIRLWDWHLSSLPQIWGRLRSRERLRLVGLRWAESVAGAVARRSSLLRRVSDLIHRQRYVQVSPERLFGEARCARGAAEHLFFVVSHGAPDYTVRPIAAERVAAQMRFSMLEEFSGVLACYRSYRFAFPDRISPLLERLPEIVGVRLNQALSHLPASLVLHPYPVCPRTLRRVMDEGVVGVERVVASKPLAAAGSL
ncbi:hypothetical protein [Candidatus Laterigemmans baculatus]|uniref:hypothetical protein n=1 Tax=Candidatus Laterigemmans baculatus TaxID=2770505 RepID=UPI0013DD4463|nr:hypothetical protein [Candidatus Laterigemmans baculatus]